MQRQVSIATASRGPTKPRGPASLTIKAELFDATITADAVSWTEVFRVFELAEDRGEDPQAALDGFLLARAPAGLAAIDAPPVRMVRTDGEWSDGHPVKWNTEDDGEWDDGDADETATADEPA